MLGSHEPSYYIALGDTSKANKIKVWRVLI